MWEPRGDLSEELGDRSLRGGRLRRRRELPWRLRMLLSVANGFSLGRKFGKFYVEVSECHFPLIFAGKVHALA